MPEPWLAARAFVAKACFDVPTTRALIDLLNVSGYEDYADNFIMPTFFSKHLNFNTLWPDLSA